MAHNLTTAVSGGARRLASLSILVLTALIFSVPAPAGPANGAWDPGPLEGDGVSRKPVTLSITFPVLGGRFSGDSFLVPRPNGRRHHGQDIMGTRGQKLVACFDGRVYMRKDVKGAGHTLWIEGDNGWRANYYHLNNDTPGTKDGKATDDCIYAPGLQGDMRVKAGQLVGFMGDSGNAEGGTPHLHFELIHRETGAVVNAAPSLRAALGVSEPVPAERPKPTPGDTGPGDLRVVNGSLDLQPGEIMLMGTVLSVDLDEGLVIMSVTAVSEKAGCVEGLKQARNKKVMLYSNTVYRAQNDGGVGYDGDILNHWKSIVVVGRHFGEGTAIPARVIGVARPL